MTEFIAKRRELVTKELDDAKIANEEAQKNHEKHLIQMEKAGNKRRVFIQY